MKCIALTFSALLLVLCASAQQPTAQDCFNAIQNPVWKYCSPELDSLEIWRADIHLCDSLVVLYKSQVNKGQKREVMVFSAKTGKLIRKTPANKYYTFYENGTMISESERTITGYNIYTEKPTWAVNIDSALKADKPGSGAMYRYNESYFTGNFLYFSCQPQYLMKKVTNSDGTTSNRLEKYPEEPPQSLVGIDTRNGKILIAAPCEYHPDAQYGDTAISLDNGITCFTVPGMKILWRYKPFEKSALTNYSFLSNNENGLLLSEENMSNLIYYLVSVDRKTGKEIRTLNVGFDQSVNLFTNMPDSSTIFNRNDSLYAYDIKIFKRKWAVSQEIFQDRGIQLKSTYTTLDADGRNVFVLNGSSSLVCIDEKTGVVKWTRSYDHDVDYPFYDLHIFKNFLVVNMEDKVFAKKSSIQYTYFINRDNPNDFVAQKAEYSILWSDDATGIAYILDKATSTLLKVKLPQ